LSKKITTKGAISQDITSVAGTAPTTVGKLDIKAADGDVFVRQTTGASLHVNVDSAPTTAVTGTFWQATQPVSGTVTSNAGTNLNTSTLALETGGNLATIAGKDFATQTTLALIKAKTDNIDVALSTRTKPADTQTISGTVTTTPPSNASTNVSQMNGTTVSMNTGVRDAGTQRVTVATNDSVPVTGTFWQGTQPVSGTVSSQAIAAVLPAATTMQNAAVASGNGTSLPVTGYAVAIINIVSSPAMSGGTTVNFEASVDNTTWVPILTHQVGSGGSLVSTTTTDGDFRVNVSGYTSLRARISAYSAGTVTIKGYVSPTAAQPTTVGLASSTAVIGHVIVDTAPTTAVTGTFWQATQPVSGTVTTTPPSNASTNVAQVAGTTTDTNSGSKSAGTIRVVLATDQPALTNKLLVTPDSVALPANQSVNVAQVAGTTTDTNSGSKSAGTLRVVLATDQPALTNKLLVTPDSVALPANQSVNTAQFGGTNVVNGGLAGSQSVGGTVATNVAITDNPVNTGGQAVSSENTAVTATRKVQFVADLVGKQIVLPYANPENFVSGAITSAMTGTTTTSLIAAPAAGLRNYITQITISNSHATVGTDVIIQDGSGGTTLYTIPAAAAYGGATLSFPTPLRQPTTATAIFCANVTTGSSTKVSASGYKGA
jgi:hypothetical protein